jgi:hypothetical protein
MLLHIPQNFQGKGKWLNFVLCDLKVNGLIFKAKVLVNLPNEIDVDMHQSLQKSQPMISSE